jgi:hypothetical protein
MARAPNRAAERVVVAAQADLIELQRRPVLAMLPTAHRALAFAIDAVVDDVPPDLASAYLADSVRQGEAELWKRRLPADLARAGLELVDGRLRYWGCASMTST